MNLITYPDPVLNSPAELFDFKKLDAKTIENAMIDIMAKSNGMGLAGNQVGILAKILVIAPQRLQNKTPFAIINPEILEMSTESINDIEGCLSFPNLWLKIDRPKWVKIKYFNTDNVCIEQIFEDIDARCVLHEMDHLIGSCFTDKVSKLKLDLARKKQRKLQNGRAK
jgi:peptide deformylase